MKAVEERELLLQPPERVLQLTMHTLVNTPQQITKKKIFSKILK